MAELAVQSLVSNLRQLMLHNPKDDHLETIEKYIHLCHAFLKASAKKKRKNQIHQELIRRIGDVANEAEDIIDAYVIQESENKSMNYFRRSFTKAINLHDVARELQSVGEQVERLWNNAMDKFNYDDEDHEKLDNITEPPLIRESNVVGLEDEIKKVIGYLNEETEELDVVTIAGMPGIGKTTLAWKIFRCPEIMFQFPTRIWIHVSNSFSEKDVYLGILKNFTEMTDDISHKSHEELAKLAAAYLEKAKFLIVMDDVWSANDWDKLRISLPESNKNGRVLITSCNETVGRYASRRPWRPPHKVLLLTESESWSLLRSEVFGDQECPLELESFGRMIVAECKGLPQAILAMARTLVAQDLSSSNMTERKIAWTKVGFRVPKYQNKMFYHSLPHQLRYCFLYFGMFPYDFEIPVWKLIRMWIAEGLIQPSQDMSLERTAETYLEELISRNLVTVSRTKSDGNVKTCGVHRMMHEFCKVEAGKERENFLQEILFSDGVSEMPNCRRLCIHSKVLDFLSSKPFGPHVRSFVCFFNEDIILPNEFYSAIPQAFKLLRVLDVKPIRFDKITKDMYQFLHLRYLVISLEVCILPKVFIKFSKLQTLVVYTTSRTLDLRFDILGFTELRHFQTNACTNLAKIGKTTSINHGDQLQTLGTISPESCTKELLDRARSLKKLGIRGRLSMFLDGKSFDSLANMKNLENLKLLNDPYPYPPSEERLRSLPSAYTFPPRLRSLTLASTYLDWSQMCILGSLERLTVLKLKDHAFVGQNWETDDLGFCNLEVLHIERTDLAIWVASARHFPRLRRLQLHYCEKLREVPLQLADIPTLQHLELLYSKPAATSANKIGEEIKRKYQEGITKNAKDFKLSVFPNE